MTIWDKINLIGIILNIIGSIILVFSLSRYLTSMHGAIALHDMDIKFILGERATRYQSDIANLLTVGSKNGRLRTNIGLVLVIVGFIIQLIPYVLNLFDAKR
ncbi:MAG: hypothetical protein M3Z26_00685 [Bacteroidota bacterium]|nr:hypothetical protein [Bacteroidota bacterium]